MSNTSSFKKDYVRVLLNGPTSGKDYSLAAELINDGYASGDVIASKRRDSYGRVDRLRWGGMTTQGRLFADDLQNQINQSSFKSRLLKISIAVISFLAGASVQFVSAWIGRT